MPPAIPTSSEAREPLGEAPRRLPVTARSDEYEDDDEYEYKDETYRLGGTIGDARRTELLLAGHLACAAQFGWRPDEPTDLPSLLGGGRVKLSGSGPFADVEAITVRLRRPRRS